jgi:hypothetical protein
MYEAVSSYLSANRRLFSGREGTSPPKQIKSVSDASFVSTTLLEKENQHELESDRRQLASTQGQV